jgi:hypothetical protein
MVVVSGLKIIAIIAIIIVIFTSDSSKSTAFIIRVSTHFVTISNSKMATTVLFSVTITWPVMTVNNLVQSRVVSRSGGSATSMITY